jgi:hypothetical protein
MDLPFVRKRTLHGPGHRFPRDETARLCQKSRVGADMRGMKEGAFIGTAHG